MKQESSIEAKIFVYTTLECTSSRESSFGHWLSKRRVQPHQSYAANISCNPGSHGSFGCIYPPGYAQI